MLRMAHRLLATRTPRWYSTYTVPKELIPAFLAELQEVVKTPIPVIIASNVADYVARHRGVNRKDYPPCPPPFPAFFIEYDQPSQVVTVPINQQKELEKKAKECEEQGLDFEQAKSILNGVLKVMPERPMTPAEVGFLQTGIVVQAYSHEANDDESRKVFEAWRSNPDHAKCELPCWLIMACVVRTLTDGSIFLSHSFIIDLDENGRYLGHETHQTFDGRSFGGAFTTDVLMMTLAFMQCKNVNQMDVTKTEAPPRRWCRRQRVVELKYSVLLIDPNIGRKPRPGDRKTEGDRSGKALHICRGHFMHCVNDGVNKGLFGKGIYGTFWVPSHVRGTADLGRVIPTYNVLAPTG